MTPAKLFQRHIEDFICDHCSAAVKGNGYTNHCPKCLWSKHVDINPGDRAADCNGLMRPTRIKVRSGTYTIYHLCESCGFARNNKSSAEDNFETILAVARDGSIG